MGQIDVSIKHTIATHPQDWAEFFGVRRGAKVEAVDSDVSAISQVTDKVFLIEPDVDNSIILHLEPQGYYDPDLDRRMLSYNGLLTRRHQLCVHSAAIILNKESWGRDNTGRVQFESPLGRCRIEFEYEVLKVWETPVERFLRGGPGVLPLAPIAEVSRNKLPGIVEQMASRLEQEVTPADASDLWAATYVLVGLKYDDAFAAALLQGVRQTMQNSTTYQAIIKEGMEKGSVNTKREDLILIGTKQFGEPSDEVRDAVQGISDFAVLDSLLLRAFEVNSWDELMDK